MRGLLRRRYLEYHFKDDFWNNEKGAIDEILVKSTPKSSCWWSNLKSNTLGFRSHIDYIKDSQKRDIQGDYPGQYQESTATAKTCPSILSVLKNSYLVKSPADIVVTIDKDGGFRWRSSNQLVEILSHNMSQFITEEKNLFEGKMNLKIALQVSIRTPNVPWVFLQPTFHNNPFFSVINGPIDGKYTKSQQLNINVMVDLPQDDEPVSYVIKNGDVLCYLWFTEDVSLKYTEENIGMTHLRKLKTFFVKKGY